LPYFKSHLVRALAWSCFSETLINEISAPSAPIRRPNLPLTAYRLNWLQKLDANDLELKQYLHQHCHSTRLGLVFESFWHFFLLQDPDTELVAHNIPVRTGKVTLGEFDLIYYCRKSNRHVHLELAVKFFLGIPNKNKAPDFDQWFGPNRADRLDRKLARLTQHQLPLAYTEAGRAVINQLGIDCIDQELQVSGILFHANIENIQNPPLNPNHQCGDWLSTSAFQLAQSKSGKQDSWRYIEKPSWLGAEFNTATLLTDKHLEMATHKPIMLINDKQQRRFLVADDWAD
jgi:hypothetical protein